MFTDLDYITDKIKLMSIVWVALAFILGLLFGLWVVLGWLLVALRPLRPLWGYVVVAMLGAVAVFVHTQPRQLPEYSMCRVTAVVERKVGDNYLSLSLLGYRDSLNREFGASASVVGVMDKPQAAKLHLLDTIIFSGFVENIDDYLVDGRSRLGQFSRQGYKQFVTVYSNYPIEVAQSQGWGQGLRGIAKRSQERAVARLDSLELPDADRGVLVAMSTGERGQITPSARSRYSQGGIAHVIAISGLHVGVLVLMLSFVLGFADYIYKGRLPKMVAIVLLLWAYAFVTGMSPSVCRATLMFSLFVVGSFGITSPQNKYNILFGSALILLLFDPGLLYDIGFQLSYLAVFAIMFYLAKIEALYTPKNRILKFLYLAAVVTLVVQLFTLPLTLYAFGTISTLAIVNNIAVTLFLPFILIFTACYMVVPLGIFETILRFIFSVINHALDFTLSLKIAVVKDVEFGFLDLWLVYLAYAILSVIVIKSKYR